MNCARLDALLQAWEDAYRSLHDAEAPFGLRKEAPAAPKTIAALETGLGTPLPPSLRGFFLR